MAIALVAAPAAAQTTDPATPPDPTVEAQEQPADPEAGSAQTDDAVQTAAGEDQADDATDTIVVTGLRRSLRSAQNIKRNSEQIVDAIVAEDIGKLPDITVSDTAARIPGIQVERQGGEAFRVLLRGLDRSYYTTTYNGREIFTAETRSVALQDFPAGAISAVEAFKTSTANLVEPGLAGLINVRSRRPFDFQGFEVAGSVWANYPKQSRDVKPNAQLLISNRWEAGESDFGALINFSYTRLHYQDSIRRHGFFIANLAGGRSPDWPEIQYAEADRWRPSVNGALQWRPNADIELYAEGLWQGYREENTDRLWQQPLWGGDAYSNIVIEDGQVISGTVTNPARCGGGVGCNETYQTQGFQGATKRKTDTYQFAVGGRYDAGPLVVTGDLARTDSTFNLRTESVDYGINNELFTVNWFTGRPGGDGPTFEVVGLDFADPANYNYRGFFEERLTAKGDDWQARLDAEYEFAGLDWLPSIQAGIRYVDRDASRRAGARYWNANNRLPANGGFQIPISQVPLDYQLFQSAFRGDNLKPTPITWLAPTFQSVWSNLEALRQFNITNGIPLDPDPNRSQNNDTNPPAPVPTRAFDINEKTLAGYGQLKFDFQGGMPIDGLIGVRVVRTEDQISGFVRRPGAPPTFEPIDLNNKYTNWLPNLNVNVHLSDQLKLRLAATKTITRPLFEQLNPGLAFGTPPCFDPAIPTCIIPAGGGNPFLKPLRSNNYDASLEYYFSPTGFASVALFRRDMRGFIVNRNFILPEPDATTGLPIEVAGPVNTNKGRIKGFEAQVSTFFDWDFIPDWARSFGAQANVTYIDAKARLPLFCPEFLDPCVSTPPFDPNATVITERIPDVSKWTYNLVAMFERGPLTARLSYNHRSNYPEGALSQRREGPGDAPINFTLQGRGRSSGRLDWSSSYAFNDTFTLFFDWTNILNIPFRSDIVRVDYGNGLPTGREIFPMVVRYNESVMSGGVRFRLGGGAPRVADAPPPYVPPPPPPPVVEPPPMVEPPPPPPPPPEPSGERG